MHEMFTARIAGRVKEFPAKLKFVYSGETFAAIMESPTLSCHHGIKNESAITTSVIAPPVKLYQFIFEDISISLFLL